MAQTQDNGNRTQAGQGTQPQSSQGNQNQNQNQMTRRNDDRAMRSSHSMGTGMSPYYSRGPFGFARRMFEDMERIMDQMMPGFDMPQMTSSSAFMPQVDVSRRGDSLIVHADLPGLSPQDLQIHVSDEGLVLSGERHQEQEHDEGGMWRRERSYGRFERLIPLPEGADLDSAQARYENGVLEISIKAPERASRRRQIQIQSGAANQSSSESKPKS